MTSSGSAAGPGPRKPMAGWLKAVLALGVVAFVGVPVFVGLSAVVEAENVHARRRADCATNLEGLAQAFAASQTDPAQRARTLSGPALFVAWRTASPQKVRMGQEMIFICPGDPLARRPDTAEAKAAYDAVDLAAVPRALCSYAARDFATFPLAPGAATPEPIAACIHHGETLTVRGGVNVAYSDGTVRWLGYEELGVSESAEVTVGPASKAPLLRTLIYGDGSVR